ncbi:acyclic terpene utilization AtuA family protein [Herbaspirillum sp. YR522]|uniref:acyclic terpene utilization AtuA family protein n=1 Tax=Herbaspirillum sp. YR522 TaxID=1144342 RepID=UPI00026F5CE9|nr:acyclic terpene utilization AtuA family protein [Herbaspirillum sp. YR522]EJM98650.1 Protein of unknown function (DUF1446) [Herbaspirillum sp. YR522]
MNQAPDQDRRTIRIGAGAGYSGDRIEPALELAEHGQLDYLIFECLAERTIAIGQQARLADSGKGYDPLLEQRMRMVLKACAERGVRIVTNMGAANPLAAAALIRAIAGELGLARLKVAAVTGDDVLPVLQAGRFDIDDTGQPVASLGERLISANAYLGIAPIIEALQAGADVVVTGRVADPALVLAPLVHEFGWRLDDWDRLGQGTLVGHLLECAGQITGGYFADPGCKDVAGLARLGFPIGEIAADGSAVITKVAGSGGQVTTRTCTEQLLYEIHDPARYFTPDVVADFSQVSISEIGPDRVAVRGGRGQPRTATLKTTLGYRDSFVGEGQISYAGPGALERAQLAQQIVRERLHLTGVATSELRFDLIGINAIGGPEAVAVQVPFEVRLRVTARTDSMAEAVRIGNEVETLYTNGPAGGGGATKSAREVIAVLSTLVPRELVRTAIHFEEL